MTFSKRFVAISFSLLVATAGLSFVFLPRLEAIAACVATTLVILNAAAGEHALERAARDQKKFLQIVMGRMGLRLAGFLASVWIAIGLLRLPVTPFMVALGISYIVLLVQEVFSIKEKFFTAQA